MKGLFPLAVMLALSGGASAATVTAIIPDAPGGGFATGTTAARAGGVITIDGGTLAGTNLFHSFRDFQLGAGETVRWTTSLTDPAGISNVVNRVTGGDVSHIDGTLDSTALPNANLFFINPAGIVFGAGAQVNVPGVARFSTAQGIDFADGARFATTTPNGSTLTTAAPASFGFLGGQGDIAIGASNLLANPARSIGLFAANLSLTGSSIAAARTTLAAVGGNAIAILLDPSATQGLSGAVTLSGATLDNGVTAGTAVLMRGGTVDIEGSLVSARTLDDDAGGGIDIGAATLRIAGGSRIATSTATAGKAGAISLAASNDLTIEGAQVLSDSAVCGQDCIAGDGGDISLRGASITLGDDAEVHSRTASAGNAGMFSITGGTVTISGADLSTESNGCGLAACDGRAGDFAIAGIALSIGAGSDISSTTSDAGQAGAISVTTSSLDLAGGSSIRADTLGAGRGGSVAIAATGSIAMSGGAFISSNTEGIGAAGSVDVSAAALLIDGGSPTGGIATGISSTANGARTGDAGSLAIRAGTINLSNGAGLSTSTLGSGNAGQLLVEASGALTLDGGSGITSDSHGAGDAGTVRVRAASIDMANSSIGSDSLGCADLSCTGGASGTVSVTADRVTLSGESEVATSAASTAPAGSVTITTTDLSVRDGAAITTNSVAGMAGDITITMPDKRGILVLDSMVAPSVITTSSGPGTGGMITISSPLAVISNGGSILALGALGGANVLIRSNYFIQSADRANTVAVNGAFALDSNIYDVSNGTAVPSVSFLDASRVLSGQCAGERASGETSSLRARAVGPYVLAPRPRVGRSHLAATWTRGGCG